MNAPNPVVSVVVASKSDWDTMKHCVEMLDQLQIPSEYGVISPHRSPDHVAKFAKQAESRGVKVIVAGGSSAAHLPGMVAAYSPLPVLGVPVEGRALHGLDALLSMVQMPSGVPVGTLAIGPAGARNAALLAAAILALHDLPIRKRLADFRRAQTEQVLATKLDE